MPNTSPKTFEYHNFLREVLRYSDPREYFLADQNDLSNHLLGVPYRNYF